MNVQAKGGYEYLITFIDDYSRYGYIYLMSHKSDSFEKFKEFKAETEKQLSRPLKKLWYDRGGEYLFGVFLQYLTENGIVSHLTSPGTPQKKWCGRKNKLNSFRYGKIHNELFNITYVFLGIHLENNNVSFECGTFQICTKNSPGIVDRAET